MKNFKNYLSLVAICALLFTSCSKEETSVDAPGNDENAVVLTFNSILNDLANRSMQKNHFGQIPACNSGTPTSVEITLLVEGESTPRVVTVDVMGDATDGYFTEYSELLKILIPNDGDATTNDGRDITLLGFEVMDEEGDLLWLAPVRTNDNVDQFAGYVDRSLPFTETVYRGTKPYFDVDVLCFDERFVNEYGYPFFDIMPGTIYNVCFFANYCVPNGREYVANYSLDLYFVDGDTEIQLYGQTPTSPETGVVAGYPQADPLCVMIPESNGGGNDVFLRYVLTLEDWNVTGSYGTAPATTVEGTLTWNQWSELQTGNDTMDYIHEFFGCEENPGGGDDCTTSGGDADGDGICDNDDDCVNGVGTNCPGGGDDCTSSGGDLDGDGICDNIDDCINGVGDGCDNGDDCDETVFVGSDTDINAIQFNEIDNGPTRWGFIYNFVGTTTKTLDIYAGASTQYNLNDQTDIGDVIISYDGSTVTVEFDFENANNVLEETLHVNISETIPGKQTLQSPGNYNMNIDEEVNDGDIFTFTFDESDGDDNNSFYIVIHGEGACKDIL